MVYSRVDKYRDLRSGLKDEVGISHDNIENVIEDDYDDKDEFLASVNRFFNKTNNKKDVEDTLTEAKTFEQMRNEDNEELKRALRSAKVSVGKEAQYNTRMDILNKIREPEKQVVRINNFDNIETSQFSKGYFVNPKMKQEEEIPADNKTKEKMTLMERLASMSPDEDAKKAKMILADEPEDLEKEEINEKTSEDVSDSIEKTNSLEDMLRQIKEKDQREVEKVLMEKENKTKNDIKDNNGKEVSSRTEGLNEKKSDRIVTILNFIIIFLVIIFVGLCGMIGYQLFF